MKTTDINKVMLFQHLAVYSFNVLNRQHCPVVLVLRVLFTVALIEVNLGKCFNEILLCMGDVVLQKLPVEAQDYLVGHFLGLEVYKAARVLPVFKDMFFSSVNSRCINKSSFAVKRSSISLSK